jgi:threonine/homoserine/homoserine lactone efflux protein
MDASIFIKGLIIGFAMAVPIGPLGVLCIRKTLTEGRARGLIIGLGAASADALYSTIAAFGLTFISDVIESHQLWVRLFGGLLLLVLGIRTLLAKRTDPLILFDSKGLWGAFVSSFLIAVTNPLTIFAFIAVFAAFGLAHALSIVSASLLVIGVFAGSGLWFLTLGSVARLFHKRLNAGGLLWVNRIAGILIIFSGIVVFVGVI